MYIKIFDMDDNGQSIVAITTKEPARTYTHCTVHTHYTYIFINHLVCTMGVYLLAE